MGNSVQCRFCEKRSYDGMALRLHMIAVHSRKNK